MNIWKYMLTAMLAFLLLHPAALASEQLAVSLQEDAFIIDENGQEIVARGTYSAIHPLTTSDGTICYAVCPPDGNQYALADEAAELLTGYDYDFIFEQDGVLICLQGDRYGALHSDGSLLAPCEYTFLTGNGDGGFLALRSNPYDDIADGVYVIDKNGEQNATGVKVLHLYTGMQEGLLPAISPENNLYGYLGTDGHWAIPPQYDYADVFFSGCAQASISTGCGLISTDGKWLISPKYEFVDAFFEPSPYVIAYTRTGVALIDRKNWQVAAEYDEASAQISESGHVAVFCPDETILYGPDGEELFRLAGNFPLWDMHADGLVVQTGEWGEECFYLYDMTGQPISDGYQSMGRLCDGLFQIGCFEVKKTEYDGGELVLNEEVPNSMRFGCIDKEGNVVLPMEYMYLYALSEDRLWLETENAGYLADLSGEILAEFAITNAGEEAP